MIEILDDFIPIHYQNHIKNMVDNMPFFMGDTTRWKEFGGRMKQFTHVLYQDPTYGDDASESTYCNQFIELFKELPEFKTHRLHRAKLNITLPYKKRYVLAQHTDMHNPEGITILYYINDSDGPTIIYNKRGEKYDTPKPPPWWWKKTKVLPKQGRLVRFPSNTIHSGNVPYKYDSRIVLNLIFKP